MVISNVYLCFRRFDDPVLLERYRLMQASPLGFPYSHPGMLAPHGIHSLLPGGGRYPPEVIAASQHMPYLSTANHISPAHSVERPKTEDEVRRQREKEAEKEREREREREREKEMERRREKERELKEREERERRERERMEREKEHQERERLEREKAAMHKRHEESRYNSLYQAARRDNMFSAEKLIGGSHPSHPIHAPPSEPLNLNKRDGERHKPHNLDRERERQYMHSQVCVIVILLCLVELFC